MSVNQRFAHVLAAVISIVCLHAALPGQARGQQPVTVFAAASMKNALDAASAAWSRESGIETSISYAATSALAKQIEAGAPADVFISADTEWMDYLAERDLVREESRSNLLGNRIVLIASRGAPRAAIETGFDLPGLLGDGRLAMASPDSVPAGRYGKAALEALGVWDKVESRVAGAENVRAALQYVSRGEAPYGIVYETDAKADSGVEVVGTFPEGSHPPIVYPVALLRGGGSPASADYLDFLRSTKARALFEAAGFKVLPPATP